MSPDKQAREPPERRSTTKSQSTFDSFRRRNTGNSIDSQSSRGLVQDQFPCYQGLSWADLSGYLLDKWPNMRGRLRERKELDRWVFEIPEHLTKQDKANISALRDRNLLQQRRSVTPE